ncbi:MAG: Ig-like domain repeat protein, partial [Acidobacteria bacterium Pan2503]|nr:Ig-like domain repeat protein [Candidatus Acidoferrum panamensis]
VAGYRLNLSFNNQPIGFLWNSGTFTDLGTGGGPQSWAYGINNSSQIVGASQFSANGQLAAFVWQNGAMTNLDPNPNEMSRAYAINTSGEVAGLINNGSNLPVIWKPAAIAASPNGAVRSNNVVTITTTSAHNFAIGDSVTIAGVSDGTFNGAFTIATVPSATTFTYAQSGAGAPSGSGTAWGKTMLPTLHCAFASCQGEALAINDLGQVVGWGVDGTVNVGHPVMWDANGQPTDLFPIPGNYAEANGINDSSVVVGYLQPGLASNSPIRAFSWQGGTLNDLGAVGSDTNSGAWGINTKGDIVGISATNSNAILVGPGGGGRAFLRTNGTMYDLTSLLAPGTSWNLDTAFAINDNGQIVGTGRAPDQMEHGYLLTPIAASTTTALAGSANPSVFGQQVSFTATVSPTAASSFTPTGNVTFNDGATVLGTVALSSGTATFNTAGLAVGGHTITASYGGDTNFTSSTSSTLNEAVSQAATTTTFSASPNPSISGQLITLTAAVNVLAPGSGTPTGTVTFLDGTVTLGTATLNSAANAMFSTSSLAVGSHNLTASYGGDTNFTGSTTSSAATVTVQAPPPPAQIIDNETITVTDAVSFSDVVDTETVHVADAAFVTPVINVTAPVVEYSAGSLGFGNVLAGQTGTQSLTVLDIGEAPLLLSSAAPSPGSAFTIAQVTCSNGATSLPTTLPVGGACTLLVSYLAPLAGAASDTLTFTDNAALSNVSTAQGGSSYTQSIPLNGSGTSTPPPPPPPSVIPVTDNETITVTDAVSFSDVVDTEMVHLTDAAYVTPLIRVT